uniref:Uncharacterized protein n=1 Tax=Arundo donax TaxID=35708 RepID=A0A0A8Z0A4_ARUDO
MGLHDLLILSYFLQNSLFLATSFFLPRFLGNINL